MNRSAEAAATEVVDAATTNAFARDVVRPLRPHRRERRGEHPRALLPETAPSEVAPRGGIVEGDAPRAILTRERIYRRTLATSDALMALAAFVLAFGLPGEQVTWPAVALLPLLAVGALKLYGLYDRDDLVVRKTTLDDAPKVFHVVLAFIVLVWLAEDVALAAPMRRLEAVAFGVLLFSLLLLGRRFARSLAAKRAEPERCMLVGEVSSYHRLAMRLEDGGAATLVACVPLAEAHAAIDAPSASIDGLRRIAREFDVHRVIVEPSDDQDQVHDVVRAAKRLGVRVSFLPRVSDVLGASVVREEIAGVTLYGLRRFDLTRSSDVVKRAFDLAGATAALAVLAPVFALVTLAIRLDSRGPVLFRQRRIGRHGEQFEIFKFRSMVADAEALKDALRERNETDGVFKIADDPRITRAGRILRKTSLDELPQLLNVLRGDMSLVGPRPLVIDEDSLITGWDRRRLHLKPGITGPWQIAGKVRLPLAEMVRIDYRYVADWSLWNDVKIVLRTVVHMAARSNV